MLVESEISKLQKVILHKPRLALKHLTPNNCQSLFFNDVLWVDKAQEEHDYFEIILRHNGCEVYLLHDLLSDILEIPEARNWLLSKRIQHLYFHPQIRDDLLDFFDQHNHDEVAAFLLEGLTFKESGFSKKNLSTYTMRGYDFILPPLPNHLFPRDASCWIGRGVTINSMYFRSRRAETLNLIAIYKFHPIFKREIIPLWYGDDDIPLPPLSGGDILVLNEKTILIGLSRQTSAEAIEILAQSLFAAHAKQQIIVVNIPKIYATHHLGALLSMVNEDTFATAFSKHSPLRAWRLRPNESSSLLCIESLPDFYQALAEALQVPKLNLISVSGDYFEVQREQWMDSTNLLTIAPGEVIAFDRNVIMNRKLRKAGIVVHEIPSSELSRARGGVRSLTCPLLRL